MGSTSFEALTNLAALEDAAKRGDLPGHRRRLLTLATILPPISPIPKALVTLAGALQLDLALLGAFSEALLPVLGGMDRLSGGSDEV
jgi:hypothetical protein